MLGASLAFLIARTWAATSSSRGPARSRVRERDRRRGFLAVLYARIAPACRTTSSTTPPADDDRLRGFAAATALGAAPRAFAYTALGGSLDDLGSPEAIVAIVVLVVMALGGLVALRSDASGSGAGSSSPASPTAGPP